MAFSVPQNPLRCRCCRMLFLFLQLGVYLIPPCRYVAMFSCRHVAMPACRHGGMSAYVVSLGLPCRFPGGLVDGCKSVEVLKVAHKMLICCLMHTQLPLNKCMMPNKRQQKEEVRVEPDAAAFPLHRPFNVVGILLSLYIVIYQHSIISIQQFNRISEALQQPFGHGVIPAHAFTGLIASISTIHIGCIGKPVGCWR